MTGTHGTAKVGDKTVSVGAWGITPAAPKPDPYSHPDFRAMVRAMRDAPDDVIRLAAADWLDEHGEGDRAEFIRVQCELARLQLDATATPMQLIMTGAEECYQCCAAREQKQHTNGKCRCTPKFLDLRRRQRELLGARGNDWIPEPFVSRINCQWRRGFVDSMHDISANEWLTHADAILALHPVTRVRLTTFPAFGNTPPAQPLAHNNGDGTTEWAVAGTVVTLPNGSSITDFFAARWGGVAFTLPPRHPDPRRQWNPHD